MTGREYTNKEQHPVLNRFYLTNNNIDKRYQNTSINNLAMRNERLTPVPAQIITLHNYF